MTFQAFPYAQPLLASDASLTADQRIRIAAKGGYDLEPFRARLTEEASNARP